MNRPISASLLGVFVCLVPVPIALGNGATVAPATPEITFQYEEGMTVEEVRAIRAERRADELDAYINQYRKMTQAFPERAEYWRELIEVLLEHGRTDQAIEACKQCLDVHPYYAPVRLQLATLYERAGELDYAVREYRMIVTDFPRWVQARVRFAILLEKMDRRVEAIEQWTVVKERTDKTLLLQTATRRIDRNQ